MIVEKLLEKNFFPEWLIRLRIQSLLRLRLRQENHGSASENMSHKLKYIQTLKDSPIALHTDAANEQHYEVPAEFFQYVMGPRMKYSSGYWPSPNTTFPESEEAMLELYIERSELENGMDVLDLGCGWGSLSLYIAEKFPKCKIVGVSNSSSQREFILQKASEKGFKNIQIITQDMNHFRINKKFDRILSIEMLEHMRNYQLLFHRLTGMLKPKGKVFIHIFTHKEFAYPFEVKDETDWMAKYFFTGGQMPSDDLLLYFQDDFLIENHWIVNGTHYAKTSRAWLENLKKNKEKVMPILEKTYGKESALKMFVYWKVFFMACEELFGFNNGNEWFVSHYLFTNR